MAARKKKEEAAPPVPVSQIIGENLPVPTDEQIAKKNDMQIMQHGLKMWKWPGIDFEIAEDVESRINMYYSLCWNDGMKPSFPGLCYALGVTKNTYLIYMHGQGVSPEVKDLLNKAYLFLEAQWSAWMEQGTLNTVSGIFLAKNHFGYQDKTDVIIETKDPFAAVPRAEDVAKKYLDEHDLN